eukprot:TRINITY_DN37420_c0_g1_i2.p1 TRINITY_DN37420_c0_g1~~TRINITY_DN37420_c0_g1_i2.p1  ORF type:complete len:205 (-),score=16.90 TRINITY_DN37420_c0_g1_i2:381-995(-)
METATLAGHGLTLFLLLCAWIVALGGLAAVQEQCTATDVTIISTVTSLAPKRCSEFWSYQWWQIALEFFFWVYYATVLAIGEEAMISQKAAIASLTGVLMVLYMQSTTLFYDILVADPEYLVKFDDVSEVLKLANVTYPNIGQAYDDKYITGDRRTRLQVTVSGFALVVFFHCILIFVLSPFNSSEEERVPKGITGAPPPGGQA